MDIGINTANGNFSLRAAALIIQNNQLLVIKHDHFDCFYTIGGGINVNEASSDAVIREVFEETGYLLSVDRLVYIQERFYPINHTPHHEVVFFYLMKSADVRIENGTCTDHPEEKLYWLPLDELRHAKLVPEFLRTALTHLPEEIVHIISEESP